mmetsp:Transcript_22002/g.37117  ORF Transcript_22002/g.37117 Transcript_22002/m.37117 type:complete len:262 (+) Transcript_22002:109-894(+)
MSFLPSLLRQNSRPYEKQISSAKKHEKIRRENSSSVLDKPIVKTKTRIKQCSGVEKTARSSEYDEMSFMQRVDLALESYGNVIDENPDIASCVKRTKTTIKHIADKFGLEWKALKQHIGYASRDHLFFDNFSMEYYIDHMEGLIARQPLRWTHKLLMRDIILLSHNVFCNVICLTCIIIIYVLYIQILIAQQCCGTTNTMGRTQLCRRHGLFRFRRFIRAIYTRTVWGKYMHSGIKYIHFVILSRHETFFDQESKRDCVEE